MLAKEPEGRYPSRAASPPQRGATGGARREPARRGPGDEEGAQASPDPAAQRMREQPRAERSTSAAEEITILLPQRMKSEIKYQPLL